MRSLIRLGVRSSDAEDVTQDVFLAVYARLSDYDVSRPPKPWLFAFAFRAASNYRRLARHRVERPESEHPKLPGGAVNPQESVSPQEHALEAAGRRALLARALENLDFDHRAALVAVDLEEVAPKEAAEAMRIPLNTLYSRVRNGRKKLRAAIEDLATPNREPG